MMGVNQIVGFLLPDWIADLVPGKYPVHSEDGTVKPNFKSKVLDIVTGEFEAFKIPIPYGHIWDSFKSIFRIVTWNNFWSSARNIYGLK